MENTVTPDQPEPAESLDELRRQLKHARARLSHWANEIEDLKSVIKLAEADERDVEAPNWTFDLREHEVSSTVDGPDVDEALARLLDQKGARAVGVPSLVEEMAEDDPIAIADEVDIAALRTAVQATGALLKAREEIATRRAQWDARWLEVQHRAGAYAERTRVLARRESWRQALEIVNAVIERELS